MTVVKLTFRRGLFISIHMPHTWHDGGRRAAGTG